MIYNDTKKEITLSPVDPFTQTQFDIATVAGRDAIAEQIQSDIDEASVQLLDDGPRSHLGASEIGEECQFLLWANFRWLKREKFQGRMLRLFNRGHLEEERMIQWLTAVGFAVTQVDVDGKQIRFAAVNGHFGGSCDGQSALPTRYGNFPDKLLLEFKTANDKLFKDVNAMGVVKAKPMHWSQACMYGRKFDIHYLLYMCVNKNNDDLDIELLELDWGLGEAEEQKADAIINSYFPPLRILGHNQSYYKCKYCAKNSICHLGEQPDKNCRSCQFAQPVEDGQWKCHQWQCIIPKGHIAKGCDAWRPLQVL